MYSLIRWIRILIAVLAALPVLWMLTYRMFASAAWGAVLVWFLWPRVSRTWKTAWVGLVAFVLLPIFGWEVSLSEYARETERISCTVRYAMGRQDGACADVDFRRVEAGDTGPVLSTRQRIGVAGLGALLIAGGYAVGFPEVAGETLRLMTIALPDTGLKARPVSERRRLCEAGAADGGPVVTGASDFFLDSTAFRKKVAAFAQQAAGAPRGTALEPVEATVAMGEGDNSRVYFGGGARPMTARTALALCVPGATLSATARGRDRVEVVWEGGIFFPAGYAFSFTVPTLRGPVTARLDESLFCGLQMDGWMHPYTQRWVANVSGRDRRLTGAAAGWNEPGRFERAAQWGVRMGWHD